MIEQSTVIASSNCLVPHGDTCTQEGERGSKRKACEILEIMVVSNRNTEDTKINCTSDISRFAAVIIFCQEKMSITSTNNIDAFHH
jgi:hypothetical protein